MSKFEVNFLLLFNQMLKQKYNFSILKLLTYSKISNELIINLKYRKTAKLSNNLQGKKMIMIHGYTKNVIFDTTLKNWSMDYNI